MTIDTDELRARMRQPVWQRGAVDAVVLELLDELERLRAENERFRMREEQRRSFAYGNVHLSNPDVTREMVDRAAERIAEE